MVSTLNMRSIFLLLLLGDAILLAPSPTPVQKNICTARSTSDSTNIHCSFLRNHEQEVYSIRIDYFPDTKNNYTSVLLLACEGPENNLQCYRNLGKLRHSPDWTKLDFSFNTTALATRNGRYRCSQINSDIASEDCYEDKVGDKEGYFSKTKVLGKTYLEIPGTFDTSDTANNWEWNNVSTLLLMLLLAAVAYCLVSTILLRKCHRRENRSNEGCVDWLLHSLRKEANDLKDSFDKKSDKTAKPIMTSRSVEQ